METETIVPIFGMLLTIIITLGAFVMVVYLRKFKNVERMTIIEKGLAPDLFNRDRASAPTLRWSFLLIGAGFGFLIGYWLDSMFNMEEVGYFSMLFIFGGIGLGAAYFIEEKKNNGKN